MIRTISHRMLIPQILAAMTGSDCELSAYGFSTPLIIVIASIGLMMANGVQMECSRAIGRGDLYDANSCYSTSIAMSVLVGSVIIIIVFAFCDQFCYILGAGSSGGDAQVFAQTSGYIRGYVPGIIFMFFYCLTGPYLQTMGDYLRSGAELCICCSFAHAYVWDRDRILSELSFGSAVMPSVFLQQRLPVPLFL